MSRPWIFISPSSRGIGLALTRHLLRNTTLPILATARSNPDEARRLILRDLPASSNNTSSSPSPKDRLHTVRLDVTDESTAEAAAREAERLFPRDSHHLRLAFALPGILHPEKSTRNVNMAHALDTFRVNALGPLLLMKWFGDFLPRKRTELAPIEMESDAVGEEEASSGKDSEEDGGGKGGGQLKKSPLTVPPHAVWTSMSARVGSTAENRRGGWYSYRASKAAVNSLTRTFDLQLLARSGERAMALAYHPGTVKTDLSREFWESVEHDDSQKLFTPEYAAEKMAEVVMGKVGVVGRGRCWDWKGEEIQP